MIPVRTKLLACTGLLALSATSVSASVDEYSVAGNSTVQVNLELCSAETQLAVAGNNSTDLDFVVTSPSGGRVHSDQGIDDYLSIVVEKNGEGCATFTLDVANLGEDSNDFTVVLEPITESSPRITKYIVGPNATETVNFKACGTSADLVARGDGDTDLDFIVRNSDGAVVHENDDLSDETTATLAGLLSDCETFEMDVQNLGGVYNALVVMVSPDGVNETPFAGTAPSSSIVAASVRTSATADAEGAGEYRADANSSITVNLPVCTATRLEVRGDGDTDLDFTINNSDGETVHSDFDLTDVTFTTLRPSDTCETFSMEVDNLGDVYNVFNVTLTDAANLGGASGNGQYRVNASSETKVALRVCSTTRVSARGDGDTDLDFDVTDENGATVHSDYDLTDQTEFTLNADNGCVNYQMAVDNLGDVYNVLTIAFDGDVGEALANAPTLMPARPSRSAEMVGSGPGEYRAEATSAVSVELPVCEPTFLSVTGDGDTDLDFVVTESSGRTVHSDYDLTDVTSVTLVPSDGCETFTLNVDNLGDVYNVFTVSLEEGELAEAAADAVEAAATASIDDAASATATVVEVGEDTASTDGNNRNVAILNRTGEALNSIYWSNSATLEWGENKLGTSSTLARGQQWNVNVSDGSNACLFDFKAITASAREIAVERINVCEITSVAFE